MFFEALDIGFFFFFGMWAKANKKLSFFYPQLSFSFVAEEIVRNKLKNTS